MNDQQTANILNEIITSSSESKRRSLSAASNNNNSGNEVQMLHNLLVNGKFA